VPILIPAQPAFATASEAKVWQLLCDQLGDDDVLICGQRVSARDKDHEIDLCIGFADAGIVVVEVKGGRVWYDGGWWIDRRGREERIDPVTQAREAQYALRS
jgi:hypothetical protein